LVPPPIDRAFDPREIAVEGDLVCGSVIEGVVAAAQLSSPNGLILVTGSVFTIGAARGFLLGEASDPAVGL
jgi:hypothetical protein